MNYIDPTSVSPKSTAMRYGLIWGLIAIVLGLLAHIMGWNDPVNPNPTMSLILGAISLGLTITMLVLAVRQHRDQELGGYITFGRGFYTGFMTTLIYALIATVWAYILMNLIAPDMFAGIEDKMISDLEAQGKSDEEIEMAVSFSSMFTSPMALTVMTFFGSLIFGSLVSLVVGAVMKKDAPNMV